MLITEKKNRELMGIMGSGTELDPFLLDSRNDLHKYLDKTGKFFNSIFFEASNDYFKIVNCDLSVLTLRIFKCTNIVLENCTVQSCDLVRSRNIWFINCQIKRNITLFDVQELIFLNCRINFLDLELSGKNLFSSCKISELMIKNSRGNKFEKCSLPYSSIQDELFNPPIQNKPKKFEKFQIMMILFLFITFTTFGILFIINMLIATGSFNYVLMSPAPIFFGFNIIPTYFFLDIWRSKRKSFKSIQPILEELNQYGLNHIMG